MFTVEEALAKILTGLAPLPFPLESVALTECLGRALAEDLFTDVAMPAFTNSAVDGYAVRAQDIAGAGEWTPVLLTCIGDIPAGVWPELTLVDQHSDPHRDPPGAHIAKQLGKPTCARIMTGAPLPVGADAVVMVEDTTFAAPDSVAVRAKASVGQHVRFAGEDVRAGERVLVAGTLLRPAAIGLLAQIGRTHVPVVRAPRVAIFSTGDEVVALQEGVLPPPGKIRNSNSYALAALVQQAGGQVVSRRHLPDDLAATQAAFRQAALPDGERQAALRQVTLPVSEQKVSDGLDDGANFGAESNIESESEVIGVDIIVTTGGVSVGDRDFVKTALESLGTLDFWRVAMKPGKPLAFGRIGSTLFFGLPGNPVSAQVTFELFVRPVLWKLSGRPETQLARRQVEAVLSEAIAHIPGRREYVRAITEWQSGQYVIRPVGGQSSANGHSLALANSLLIVPEEAEILPAGAIASVLLLE